MVELYVTKQEVHNHAKDAIGKSMKELNGGKSLTGKSGPGDAFEHWFGKAKDSLSEPDMREAQVELKATPFKKLKGKDKYSAKERLVFNIINYNNLAKEEFETSHFLHKNKTIELAFYEYLKDVSKDSLSFKEVALYTMADNLLDFTIIKRDWENIQKYVLDGKADQLNEGMAEYLSPCTKGASAKSVRTQPYSDVPAKQRAFSFKTGYMTHLLRTYILGKETTESIFKERFDLVDETLDDAILRKLNVWKGKSVDVLKKKFGVDSESKSANYLLASRMLGLAKGIKSTKSSSKITEFEKANIQMKTIYFDEKGKNKENMSFKAFDFRDLLKQQWDDENGEPSAEWHKFLLETKFLFIVFQCIDGIDTFMGAKFFNVPSSDIEGSIQEVWQDTVSKISEGITLTAKPSKKSKSGYEVKNTFKNKSDNMICHVRPHSGHADYSIDGKDSNCLPVPAVWINRPSNHELFSDNWMTTQSFWFNHDYIREQVADMLVINK